MNPASHSAYQAHSDVLSPRDESNLPVALDLVVSVVVVVFVVAVVFWSVSLSVQVQPSFAADEVFVRRERHISLSKHRTLIDGCN